MLTLASNVRLRIVKFEPRNDGVAVVEFVLVEPNVKSVEASNAGGVDQLVEVVQLPELEPVHV